MKKLIVSSIKVLFVVLFALANASLVVFNLVCKAANKLFRKAVGIEKLERLHKQELAAQREELIAAFKGENFDAVENKIIVPAEVENSLLAHITNLYGKDMAFVEEVFNRVKDEYISIFDRPNFAYDTVTLGSNQAINKLIKYHANKLIKEKIAQLTCYDLDKYFEQVTYLNSLYRIDEEPKLEVSGAKKSADKIKRTVKDVFKLDQCEVNQIIREAGLDPDTIDKAYIDELLDKVTNQAAAMFLSSK